MRISACAPRVKIALRSYAARWVPNHNGMAGGPGVAGVLASIRPDGQALWVLAPSSRAVWESPEVVQRSARRVAGSQFVIGQLNLCSDLGGVPCVREAGGGDSLPSHVAGSSKGCCSSD